jgi:hypothetical protein
MKTNKDTSYTPTCPESVDGKHQRTTFIWFVCKLCGRDMMPDDEEETKELDK